MTREEWNAMARVIVTARDIRTLLYEISVSLYAERYQPIPPEVTS